jgi:hypothetical protein
MGGRLGDVQRRYLRGSRRASIFFVIAFCLAVRELIIKLVLILKFWLQDDKDNRHILRRSIMSIYVAICLSIY